MGLLDKAKAAAEQAASKAKEGVQDVQVKRELSEAYSELGRQVFVLADRGDLSHPELAALVERIRTLRAQTEADGAAPAPEATASEPPPPSQPPAMPSN